MFVSSDQDFINLDDFRTIPDIKAKIDEFKQRQQNLGPETDQYTFLEANINALAEKMNQLEGKQ